VVVRQEPVFEWRLLMRKRVLKLLRRGFDSFFFLVGGSFEKSKTQEPSMECSKTQEPSMECSAGELAVWPVTGDWAI